MASRMSVNGALQAIKADLEIGLNDVAAGRVRSFDTARVIEQGKRLSSARGGFRRVALTVDLPEQWIKALKEREP
jgi:hypothetical protein